MNEPLVVLVSRPVSSVRRLAGAAAAAGTWAVAGLLLEDLEAGPLREITLVSLAGAVLASILLAALQGAARKGGLSLLQGFLLASLFAHVFLAYALGSWTLVAPLLESPAPLETELDSEALAKEALALRMREEPVAIGLAADLPAPARPPGEPSSAFVPAPPAAAELERPRPPALPPVEPVLDRRDAAPVADPPSPPVRFPARPPEPALGPLAAVSEAPVPRPDLPAFPLPAVAAAPAEPPAAFALRDPQRRGPILERLGGDAKTEAAVERALDWLRRRQEEDGRWSNGRFGGKAGHDVAATGLALLCFTGWGARHDRPGPDGKRLRRALDWLLGEMAPDGDWTGGRNAGMYDQGIGTLALAEAYGMTRDPRLLAPLRKAVGLILRAQHPVRGGWRYLAVPRDGDTSVTGWQMMALRAAELGGVEVPAEAWKRAENWLDGAGSGRSGGLYSYLRPPPTPAMTAQGMIGRQILGAAPAEARQKESARYLEEQRPDRRSPNFYFWYVGSLALYAHQGTAWSRWNDALKPILLAAQVPEGEDAGSWAPEGAWAAGCGRLTTTALATLCLEVYYRYARADPSPK